MPTLTGQLALGTECVSADTLCYVTVTINLNGGPPPPKSGPPPQNSGTPPPNSGPPPPNSGPPQPNIPVAYTADVTAHTNHAGI